MDGTPSVSMRAILLLMILITSGDSDKQKQAQFEKGLLSQCKKPQKGFAADKLFFFVDSANHLRAKTSTQLPIVKPPNDTLETDQAHISHKSEESLMSRTSVTTVALKAVTRVSCLVRQVVRGSPRSLAGPGQSPDRGYRGLCPL